MPITINVSATPTEVGEAKKFIRPTDRGDAIIISMYGGGFATVPAYLKDMFGVMQVGAIHGRLLVAWSIAAILGPMLINYIRAYQIETLGLPPAQAYSLVMYIMAGLLVIGFVCNALIKPVDTRYHA